MHAHEPDIGSNMEEILGVLATPTGDPINSHEAVIISAEGSYNISIKEDRNRNQEFIVPIVGSLLESPNIGDEEQLASNGSPADIESPNNQEEPDNVDDDPGRTEQQTTRLTDHIVAPILLSAVLILLGIVFGKLKTGNYTPLSVENPFVPISAIACGLVYLAFSVLLWMYEGPEYMILKGVYYILCNLAFDSLLVVLFTTT